MTGQNKVVILTVIRLKRYMNWQDSGTEQKNSLFTIFS